MLSWTNAIGPSTRSCGGRSTSPSAPTSGLKRRRPTMTDRTYHPVCLIFPMMTPDELQSLADSIKTCGLLSPIIVDAEGRIVDGRQRYIACGMAGVEPKFVTNTTDPLALAISMNIHRSSKTVGQRAMGLVTLAGGRSNEDLARLADCTPVEIEHARD